MRYSRCLSEAMRRAPPKRRNQRVVLIIPKTAIKAFTSGPEGVLKNFVMYFNLLSDKKIK